MGDKVELNIEPFGNCIYCSDEGKILLANRGIVEHMTIFKRADGHIHVHGPLRNEELIIEMIRAICGQVDIGLSLKGDEEEKAQYVDGEFDEAEHEKESLNREPESVNADTN